MEKERMAHYHNHKEYHLWLNLVCTMHMTKTHNNRVFMVLMIGLKS